MSRTIAAASAGLVLAASAVTAQQEVDPTIAAALEARESHMHLYAFNIGPLVGMAQEKIPYDAAVASAAASNLAAVSKLDQSRYWPEGSETGTIEGSDALPAIWQDPADFDAKKQGLIDAAMVLETAAGTDLDALKAATANLGKACGACHKAFRKPNE